VVAGDRHGVEVLMSQVRNHHPNTRLLHHHGLLVLNWNWHNHWLHHRLLRVSNHNVCTSEHTSVTLGPVGEVQVVDMENVVQGSSAHMVGKFEVIAPLHDAMVKEHSMRAGVSEEFLALAVVGSYHSPLSYVLHTAFEMHSKFAFLTLPLLIPVYDKLEIGRMSGLHGWHSSNNMKCVLLVVRYGHWVQILMTQVRYSYYSDLGYRLYVDNGLL